MARLDAPPLTPHDADVARLLSLCLPNENGCWLWAGRTNHKGYGTISRLGRDTAAHRVSYTLLVGPIPTGLAIHHECHNRLCINPDHLSPVDPSEHQRHHLRRAASESATPGHANGTATALVQGSEAPNVAASPTADLLGAGASPIACAPSGAAAAPGADPPRARSTFANDSKERKP